MQKRAERKRAIKRKQKELTIFQQSGIKDERSSTQQ
jgi:hypothetical protein